MSPQQLAQQLAYHL